MSRKRKNLPPFEVMGRSKQPPEDVTPPAPEPAAQTSETEEAEVNGSYAQAGPTRPHFVLRIPQAYGLLLAGGLIGIVVLAYWLGMYNGRTSGHKAGYEQAQREYEAERQARRRIGSVVHPQTTGGGGRGMTISSQGAGAASGGGSGDVAYLDTRQEGLNYFVVALYPLDEALRAYAFLKENGVASFVQQGQNTSLYEVIATRGFKEVNTDSRRRFERELDRLGRLWKQQDKGPSEFDPYLRKH